MHRRTRIFEPPSDTCTVSRRVKSVRSADGNAFCGSGTCCEAAHVPTQPCGDAPSIFVNDARAILRSRSFKTHNTSLLLRGHLAIRRLSCCLDASLPSSKPTFTGGIFFQAAPSCFSDLAPESSTLQEQAVAWIVHCRIEREPAFHTPRRRELQWTTSRIALIPHLSRQLVRLQNTNLRDNS